MKAILRNNRKVIVDVEPYPNLDGVWIDKNSDAPFEDTYYEDELDFVEYYGG